MAPRPAGARARLLELRRAPPPSPAIAVVSTSSPPPATLETYRKIWAQTTRAVSPSSLIAAPSNWADSLRRTRPSFTSSPALASTAASSSARPLTTSAILAAHGGSPSLAVAAPQSDERHLQVRREPSRKPDSRRALVARGLEEGFFDSSGGRIAKQGERNSHVEQHEKGRPEPSLSTFATKERSFQADPRQADVIDPPWYELIDDERLATALFTTTTSAMGSSSQLNNLAMQVLELSGIPSAQATATHIEEASWLVMLAISKAPQDGPAGTSDHDARLAALHRLYLETLHESFSVDGLRPPKTLERLRRGALHAFIALRLSVAEHEAGGAALHHLKQAAEVISDERLKPSQARYLFRRLVVSLAEKEQEAPAAAHGHHHSEGRGRKDAPRKAAKAAWEGVTSAAVRLLEQGALTKGGGSARELSLAAVASPTGPATWAVEDQQKDRGLRLLSSALVDKGHSQLFLRLARAAQACLAHTHARAQIARASGQEDDDDLVLRSPSGFFRLRSTPELSDPPPFLSAKGIERLLSRLIRQGSQRAALELVYVLPDSARTLGMYARLLSRWGETDPRVREEAHEQGEVSEGQLQLATLLRHVDGDDGPGGRTWGWRARRRFSTKAMSRASMAAIQPVVTGPPPISQGEEGVQELSVSQRISRRVWADVQVLLEREQSRSASSSVAPQDLLALYEARITSHARHRTPALIEADVKEMERIGLVTPAEDVAHSIASLSHKAQTSAVRCFADAGDFGRAIDIARVCLAKAMVQKKGAPAAAPRRNGEAKSDPAAAQRQHATRLLNVLFRAALRNSNTRTRAHIVGRRQVGRATRWRSRISRPDLSPVRPRPDAVVAARPQLSTKTISFRRHHGRRLRAILKQSAAQASQSLEGSSTAKARRPSRAMALPHLPSSLLHRLSGLRALAQQYAISADAATLNMVLPYVFRSAAAHPDLDKASASTAGKASKPHLPSRRQLLHLAVQEPKYLLEVLQLCQILPRWDLEPLAVPAVDFERRVRPLLRAYVRSAFDRGEAREARRAIGILHEERDKAKEAMEMYAARSKRGGVK